MKIKHFSVLAILALSIAVPAVLAGRGRNGPAGKSNVAHLYLVEKDPTTWNIVEDGAWGKMKYNLAGEEFEFVFNGHGLEPETEYCLIYYADTEDRYVDWGGDNPGALIATGTTNKGGNIHLGGSVELDMDLPHPDDANGYYYDYTQSPDNYEYATGAKIWLVPSSYYNEDGCEVTEWRPEEFLFETDLITYDDTDEP